jgi:hypothetical protein
MKPTLLGCTVQAEAHSNVFFFAANLNEMIVELTVELTFLQ